MFVSSHTPFVGNKSALLLDSWTEFRDPTCLFFEGLPPEKSSELSEIPPSTTGKNRAP